MIHRCFAIFLLIMIFALSGCAARKLPASKPVNLYGQFRSDFSNCNATGIKAKASLYYTSEGSGHRTTMNIWGDFNSPLRLDVRAGIGAYVAHLREDDAGLTAFYPEQKTAYTHSSPYRAVQLLGLPFPFSLKDLAGLIAGCYPELIPESYKSVNSIGNSHNLLYAFDAGPVSSITLTNQGFPIEITGRGNISWRMELSSYEMNENGKMLPEKITVFTKNGDKAVLRIKSRTLTTEKWAEDSMKMALPEGTETIRLDKNGYIENY
ncbi:hypothetical protein [Maridesulfovibrio hydrothermalis]|uniref:Outer-membrane lipoprotein LolB n=1 Tax=Maridesulfovibrio hydrothermalis AM13 = DSM 14728 TaxID=1121451 RepID=L0RAF7_9BACT|nr:hypothetical protein [Maridesulfovibrio hydrothermalis]CCO23175.1 conserved exported protein of unknown function [Maridesulfovibrio hydrothermalis AM13 = DSM 14728]